jgi:hypothetical protein
VAIAFDAVSGATGVVVSSLTFAHTVASGGILVVFAGELADTPTVTGVTYNGTALTQLLPTTDHSGGVIATNSAWVIHNPTTGSSQNIVVTFSSAGGAYCAAHGLSYTGVANSSAAATHRTIYHDGQSIGGKDITVVDSVNGDMVLASCGNYGSDPSAGSGMTGRRFDTGIGGSAYDFGSEDTAATGANTVMTFTSDDWCTNIAFALIPSAAAATFIPSKPMNSQMRSVLAQ